jgi:pimeloyl-ACP methyl ester carboxylesterase
MDRPHRCLRLADGRQLAYAEFGAPGGRPVLYCHGFPSSRREALLLEPAAQAENARIIAPDRPGYGHSDPLTGRSIAAWAADLTALAEHLGLGRVPMVGVSGGAPYALACVFLAPKRLSACALVCPLGPIYLPEPLASMGWPIRTLFAWAHGAPRLWRLVFGGPIADLFASSPRPIGQLRALRAPPVDHRALAQPGVTETLDAAIADAMRQEAAGALDDLTLYTRDWHIPFGPPPVPLSLWHGEADGTVPVAHCHWYQRHLPGAQPHYLPGEGHFSLPLGYGRQILRSLFESVPLPTVAPGEPK